MKTTWQHNLGTEAGRIIFTAETIIKGFYQAKGFYVIPYESRKRLSAGPTVLFPRLNYNSIPRFWQKMLKLRTERITPQDFADPNQFQAIKTALSKELVLKNYERVDFTNLKVKWNKIEQKFLSELRHFIPGLDKKLRQITVMPTRFGTGASFNVPQQFPADIYIYLREHKSCFELAEAILTALTRAEAMRDLRANWEETELLVDWLLTKTSLAEILCQVEPGAVYAGTIKSTRALQKGELRQQSKNFYKELGITPASQQFFVTQGVISHGSRKITELTEREQVVLQNLIENKNSVLSYHAIGKILYTENFELKFSLWNVAKFMQRLRDRLEAQGVGSYNIQTVYGKGFTLRA